MQSFLGCDAHKHYSVFVAVDERGRASKPVRIEHYVAAYRRYLDTPPGVGKTLAPVLWLEIGAVERFARAENLASYAGLVPRVISSGGHTHHGGVCRNINRYLKWAFVEAANCAAHLRNQREGHIGLLYQRLAPNKGHGRAIVAVARHLAEASYWMLRKREPYRPPRIHNPSSKFGQARDTSDCTQVSG